MFRALPALPEPNVMSTQVSSSMPKYAHETLPGVDRPRQNKVEQSGAVVVSFSNAAV